MVLYYAPGGGYGHFCRACKVLAQLEPGIKAVIICSPGISSPADKTTNTVQQIPFHLKNDCAHLRQYLCSCIDSIKPQRIYIDSFPAGIIGECIGCHSLELLPVIYIARLLHWDSYASTAQTSSFIFSHSYIIEPLEDDHYHYIKKHSRSFRPLLLTSVQYDTSNQDITGISQYTSRPLWCIIHSGCSTEVETLIGYSIQMAHMELRIVQHLLIAPYRPKDLPPEVMYIDYFPAIDFYPFADRIISGCGFNMMQETIPYWYKHRYIPFERRFDNQYKRACYHTEYRPKIQPVHEN